MVFRARVSDEALLEAYQRTQSVYKAGREVGIHGSSAHERLQKLGAIRKWRVWTDENDELLRSLYESYAGEGRLKDLAARFGVHKTSLCGHAAALGLTKKRDVRPYASTWKYITEAEAESAWVAFKRSRLGLIAYCKKKGFDDLGFSVAMKRFFSDEWDAVLELKAPKGSLYRRGRALEYLVRDWLRGHGFFAMRSPASKTPIDILAVRHGQVVMVQCKRHGALGVAEWNEFYQLAKSVGALPVLASMETGRGSMTFYELQGEKDGSKRRQPMRLMEFRELALRPTEQEERIA
jgi:Holliday junction resolvase